MTQPRPLPTTAGEVDPEGSTIARIGLLAVGTWLLWLGLQIFPVVARHPIFALLLLVLYVSGFGLWLVACVPVRTLKWASQLIMIAALLGVTAGFAVLVTGINRSYGTDALAFTHVAAEQVLAGHNPYEFNQGPGLDQSVTERFGVPRFFVTHLVDGTPVDRLVSYPALHFLAFVPALAAGLRDLRWVIFAFELASLYIIWRVSPRWIQPVSLLVLLINPDLVLHFPAGSVTDWIWVFPLLVSAVFLHQRRFVPAGIAFGLAAAVKQQPWVVAPFVLIWILKTSTEKGTAQALRPVLRFLVPAAAAFLVPNIPFILLDLRAWVGGVLSPVVDGLVYFGQGLSLLTSTGMLPVSKSFYTSLALVVAFATVALYWIHFRTLRDGLWVFPAFILWFSYRALTNHLLFWIVPVVLWSALRLREPDASSAPAAAPTQDEAARSIAPTLRRVALPIAVALVVAFAGWGTGTAATDFARRADISVLTVADRFRVGAVDMLVVEVRNRTFNPIAPVFSVLWSGYPLVWNATAGPDEIHPGETARYVLMASSAEALIPFVDQPGMGMSSEVAEVRPFYLQMNARGSYRYFVTRVSGRTVPIPTTVNPEFRYWHVADPVTSTSVPEGWNLVKKPFPGRSATVRESMFMGKRALELLTGAHEARRDDWAEIGLSQEVVSPGCIQVALNITRSFRTVDGWPVLIQGLELAQNGELIWYGFSDRVDAVTRYQLPNGHLIVIVPAMRYAWQEFDLDVRADIQRKKWSGKTVTIKVFNAVHASEGHGRVSPIPIYVSHLDVSPQPCSSVGGSK